MSVVNEVLEDLCAAVQVIYRRLDEPGQALVVEVLDEHSIRIDGINDGDDQ